MVSKSVFFYYIFAFYPVRAVAYWSKQVVAINRLATYVLSPVRFRQSVSR